MVVILMMISTSKTFKQIWSTQIFPWLLWLLLILLELQIFWRSWCLRIQRLFFPDNKRWAKWQNIIPFNYFDFSPDTVGWTVTSSISTMLAMYCNIPETVNHFLSTCPKFQSKQLKPTDKEVIRFEITSLVKNKASIRVIESLFKEIGQLISTKKSSPGATRPLPSQNTNTSILLIIYKFENDEHCWVLFCTLMKVVRWQSETSVYFSVLFSLRTFAGWVEPF